MIEVENTSIIKPQSGFRVVFVEKWKVGKLESWKVGKLESWKVGKLELLSLKRIGTRIFADASNADLHG